MAIQIKTCVLTTLWLGMDMEMQPPWKIKFLLWLVSHYSLPMNVLRYARNLATNLFCYCYLDEVEIILHYWWDCTNAKQVWLELGFGWCMSFFQMPVHQWFWCNVHSSYLVAMEGLIFSRYWCGGLEYPHDFQEHLFICCCDLAVLTQDFSCTKEPSLVSWSCPPPSFFKLNMDGSLLSDEGVASMGLIQDELGG